MAEEIKSTEVVEEQGKETKDEKKEVENNEPKIEDLMTQLAQEKAQRAKDKNALDKALKEVGELKKSLRARQTAEEQELEAKREEEEAHKLYVAGLEDFKRSTEAKMRYISQGMNTEMAEKAAEAEIKGDMEELVALQKQFVDETVKAKEEEWLKNRPEVNTGGENDAENDPFLQGFNS